VGKTDFLGTCLVYVAWKGIQNVGNVQVMEYQMLQNFAMLSFFILSLCQLNI
jgi:hypothetical protein